jgi:hypothetical protein
MAGHLSEENEIVVREQAALIVTAGTGRGSLDAEIEGELVPAWRSKYFVFHQFASARRKKNLIKKLKHGEEWVEGTSALKPIII